MNNRIEQLEKLYQLKERNTLDALKNLTRAREEFILHKQRHDKLLEYRVDYLKQFEAIGVQGTTLGRLRNRLDFVSHLDTAIVQLNGHLAQLAKKRSHYETLYIEAKAAQDAVEKLIERVKKELGLRKNRAEQKEIDEYAQKQWYSKNIKT